MTLPTTMPPMELGANPPPPLPLESPPLGVCVGVGVETGSVVVAMSDGRRSVIEPQQTTCT